MASKLAGWHRRGTTGGVMTRIHRPAPQCVAAGRTFQYTFDAASARRDNGMSAVVVKLPIKSLEDPWFDF